MFCEDDSPTKLSPVPVQWVSPPQARSAGSRSRASIAPGFLPPLSSSVPSRHEGNRTQRHTAYRQTINLSRSRAESLRSVSPLQRQNTYDAKRYMNLAVSKSTATKEKFREHLMTYRTFRPLVTENESYDIGRSTIPHSGSAWDAVDRAIDNSHAIVDRHHADGPFLKMVESYSPLSTALDPVVLRTRETTMYQNAANLASSSGLSLSVEAISSMSVVIEDRAAKDNALFESWMRAHSTATAEEARQELLFRDSERTAHERLLRSRLLHSLHADIAEAEKYLDHKSHGESLRIAEGSLSHFGPGGAATGGTATATATAGVVPPSASTAVAAQALAWEIFLCGEQRLSQKQRRGEADTVLCTERDEEAGQLHAWVEGGWRFHTHRHETAAVRIQCAYRCYRAVRAAARRRYISRISFVDAQHAEVEPARIWAAAVRDTVDAQNPDGAQLRLLRFVVSKIEAVALRRRAERQMSISARSEIERYAAVTIQRVFRGHCGRVEALMVRHPQLRAARQHRRMTAAALEVQRVFRGFRVRRFMRRADWAARVLQRALRSSAARKARVLRRAAMLERSQLQTRQHAAECIARVLKQCVARRRIYLRERLSDMCVLQRVGRGFLSRRRVAPRFSPESVAHAVLCAQRRWRGAMGRAAAVKMRREKEVRHSAVQREDAAVVVQCWWRIYMCRRRRREQRSGVHREIVCREAAEMILRFFRAADGRRKGKNKNVLDGEV